MYLHETNLKAAADFLSSPLWQDIKRCLRDRMPEAPVPSDAVHTAAAKGFQRASHDNVIAEIEKLPFENKPTRDEPFSRPAVTHTED